MRRVSQTAFLLLFALLLFFSTLRGENRLLFPATLFFDTDPLILIATFLSAHAVESALLFSLVTLVLSGLFGRFYCGWVCPFGAIHTFVGWLGSRLHLSQKGARGGYSKRQNLRYLVLGGCLVGAHFGGQFVGYFDPVVLLCRTFTEVLFPAVGWALSSAFEFAFRFLDNFDFGNIVNSLIGLFYRLYERAELRSRLFDGALLIGVVFLVFVGLNFCRERFYCRYICPLGALLSLLSKRSLVRIRASQECTSCGVCARRCPTGAEPGDEKTFRVEECVYCFDCVDLCPENALSASLRMGYVKRKNAPPDEHRRQLLLGAAAGMIALPLVKTPWRPKRISPLLIRPPGAHAEQEFLSRCIRCGACLRVCPTNVLQPAFLQGDLDGLWTPILKFRFGYCLYDCTLCSQACPTGAIQELALERKKKLKIGQAFVDQNRCLPYAFGVSCTVCEEHCPTAPKAIFPINLTVELRDGRRTTIMAPAVEPHLCIGCGICEHVCPIVDRAGIRVSSVGEQRSEENLFLLDD